MALHATLSPSSASRWISCPASVRLAASLPREQSSSYAEEGTAAHALAELLARHVILKATTPAQHNKLVAAWKEKYDISEEAHAEMAEHATAYVVYLQARLDEHPGAQLLLEQRLPTGIKDSWGTSDAVMVSEVWLEIVDFKYGLGIKVSAEGNPQTRLYAVGALDTYGDLLGEVETVTHTIFQPRLDHVDSETLSAADLRAWRDSLKPVAAAALGPDAPFGPSEKACRFCPASGQCRAQMEWATARDFSTPVETLSPDELADALENIPLILQWAAAVQDYCLDRIYSRGEPVPGFKVVMSGGKRGVTDPEKAVRILTGLGYDEDEVTVRKPRGIGELEKLLGKPLFKQVLEDSGIVRKGDGSPSLVPDEDRRSAIQPETSAAEDFK